MKGAWAMAMYLECLYTVNLVVLLNSLKLKGDSVGLTAFWRECL